MARIIPYVDDTNFDLPEPILEKLDIRYANTSGSYVHNVTPENMAIWKAGLIAGQGGSGIARIGVHGGSTPQGAGSGLPYVSPSNPGGPFLYSSWPGRLQRRGRINGDGGTGYMVPWNQMNDDNTGIKWQPAYRFAGSVENRPLGVYGLGAKRITKTGTSSYIEISGVTGTTYDMLFANTGATGTVLVDGAIKGTFAAGIGVTGVDFMAEAGYAAGQVKVSIPIGPHNGPHTIRFYPNGADGAQITLLVSGATPYGQPGMAVSNMALSGISSEQLTLDDTTNGYTGMSVSLDASRCHLQLVQCLTNDFQGHVPVDVYRSRMDTFIQRAQQNGTVANGGSTFASNVILVVGQPVNQLEIPADHVLIPPYNDYSNVLYELSSLRNVGLIDLNELFVDYNTGAAKGWYADQLHASALGSEVISKVFADVILDPLAF